MPESSCVIEARGAAFRVEKSGRLTVTARDLDTGQDLTVVQGGSPP